MGGAAAVRSMVVVFPVALAPTLVGVIALGAGASGGVGNRRVTFLEGLMVRTTPRDRRVLPAVTDVSSASCWR